MAKVYIHPAKGGRDYGCITYDGYYEKELTLNVALKVKEILVRHDVDILMSRDKDESCGISSSINNCNMFDPDLAICIEFNSSQDGFKRGFEVYSSFDISSRSYAAAQIIDKHICGAMIKSNGVKYGNKYDRFAFIRESNCPSIVCRCCYIDNETDYELFNANQMAELIAKGILEYLGIPYVEKFYSVQIGKFDNYKDANKLQRELTKLGYKVDII